MEDTEQTVPQDPEEDLMSNQYKKRNQLILVSVGIASLLFVFFLLFKFVAPFGAVVKYQFGADKNREKVSDLKGAESGVDITTSAKDTLVIPSQVVRQEIVTFNLQLLSKDIEGVWANLRFKGEPREIKMGVRGNTNDKYLYQPLYQRDLEGAQMEKVDDRLSFWQKEHSYTDFAEFVAKPPVDKTTAVYYYDASDIVELQAKNTKAKQGNFVKDLVLRGSHTFYVQVTKGPLEINVTKQDANAYDGEDTLTIRVEKNDKQLAEQTIPDDGIVDRGGLQMQAQKVTVRVDEAKPGIYKVSLQDQSKGGDVRITHLEVNQANVVSGSPIFVLGENPTSFWTNSKEITATTVHPVGIQAIKLDNERELNITEMNKKYTFDLNEKSEREIHRLIIPKNDLIITGDGYFAFSEDSFFNPEPIKTVPLMSLDSLNNADYAIARYTSVKRDGEWKVTSIYFDPKDIKVDGDKLYFSLESPGLSKSGGEYLIDNLEVTVKKPGFFDKISGDNSDTNGEKKQNIITRTWERVKDWGRGVKDGIGGFFRNIWTKATGWIPKRTKGEPSPSPELNKEIVVVNSSPKPSPTPTPSPSPKPSVKTISLPIIILNGGAEKGTAASMSATLKERGFSNVSTGNADKYDYEQATIKYREEDLKIAEQLAEILKSEQYNSVTKTAIATTVAEIRVIIGKK